MFPKVSNALQCLDPDSLEALISHLKKDPRAQAVSDSEITANEILKYVNYMSDHITGSTAEVTTMHEEIHAITRSRGLPHLFITVNPADYHNPIPQVLAGLKRDLDKFYHKLDGNAEAFTCIKTVASNPVAGSQAFKLVMEGFIDILAGVKRPDKIGVFGEVDSYYGVVEAQGCGSLHCHFFFWLKGGLSPKAVKEKALVNVEWKQQLFSWLDDTISQDFPCNTTPFCPDKNDPERKNPAMSQPPDPLNHSFDEV